MAMIIKKDLKPENQEAFDGNSLYVISVGQQSQTLQTPVGPNSQIIQENNQDLVDNSFTNNSENFLPLHHQECPVHPNLQSTQEGNRSRLRPASSSKYYLPPYEDVWLYKTIASSSSKPPRYEAAILDYHY